MAISGSRVAGKVMEHLNNFASMGIDFPMSQLEMWIAQACDPLTTHTPNLSLNLEICDLINKHLKTYPRDAAFAIVKHVNYSSSSASLALSLLDNCAKNCGYPFHLVMSSKEFLNELVRKFPESPKTITSTQRRILELLAEWNVTLAQKSRYREDFKNIHEMYRLLEYKGYQFPHIKEETTNLEPEIVLKTEEQLENEDMKNNGLKLEELIRKGTPAALAEANDMMKLMSGYDTSKKPDYKKEVNAELDRIESKTILLNDMLNQKSPEEFRRRQDQTIDNLHSSAKVAQTRLQKFIEDNEDEERLGRLLELNDSINTVLQKYSDLKNGNAVEKNSLDRKSSPENGASGKQSERGAINLIDLDDFGPPSATATQPNTVFDPFGSPQMKSSQPVGISSAKQQGPTSSLLGDISFGNPMPQQMLFMNNNQMNSNLMQHQGPPMMMNQTAFGTLNGQPMNAALNNKSMSTIKPQPNQPLSMQSGFSSAMPAAAPPKQASPFDDLFSSVPISKPPQQQLPSTSTSKPAQQQPQDLLGLFGGSVHQSASPPPFQQEQTSKLMNGVPALTKESKSEHVIFNKNGLQIKLTTTSPSNNPQISAEAVFLNVTPVPFTELNFQVSVPKSMSLQIEPPSSSTLPPFNQAPALQKILISNPSREQLRLRFRVQYNMNGAVVSEIGDFAG